MNEKKFATIDGLLMHPLLVGVCAIILHHGTFTRTSSVVTIHSVQSHEVRFETLDTYYTLRLHPTPKTAGNPAACTAA